MEFSIIAESFKFALENSGPFIGLIGSISATAGLYITLRNQTKIKEINEKVDHSNAVHRKVNQAGLRTLINGLAETCLKRGNTTEEDLETIEPLFECYREEGGNSYICNKMQRVRRLPVVDIKKENN